MHKKKTNKPSMISLSIVFIICIVILYFISEQPSNDRDWANDQAVLPYVELTDTQATFRNIRDFTYRSTDDYDPSYYDRTYDLDTITSVDYVVVPFGTIGAAHTLLSFGFENGEHLAVSVEIRKEKGEEFSAWKGLLRQFEIMYVVASEEDVIKLRTHYRDNDVYLYPSAGSPETHKKLLLDIIARINELKDEPIFYNTITNTCTTNIVYHINKISDTKIPWDIRLLLPENSDVLARDLGLIDVDPSLSVEEMREAYYISTVARENTTLPFSQAIRTREAYIK